MAKKFTFDDAITTDIKGAASNSYIDNIKMIKIADIETNAENFYSLPDIEDLAEDIDRQGLIHSLAVAKISSEKYKLISGHRRLTAIKLLIENGKWNNETVPCYVITAKKSDAEMNLDLIMLNHTQRKYSDSDIFKEHEELKKIFSQLEADGVEIKGRLREKIAKAMHVSSAQIGKIENIKNNAIDSVKAAVENGELSISTAIYIDMDGTIARFHDENLYLERMFEKGFFSDLKPFENAVSAIEQLVNDSTAEIFILSATVNSCSLDEKQKWLDRYLPNIDKEHRIFTSLNVPKSEAIGHRLTDKDILIDDYNKNLLEWQKAGGTSVKAKNNINHKGLHGELWKGEIIDVVNGDIYSDICKLANENYYYAYISENDVEKLKQSGICYHLQMSGDRIIAKVSIAYKPILDNIVNSNRSIKCDTGSTPKM